LRIIPLGCRAQGANACSILCGTVFEGRAKALNCKDFDAMVRIL
jgi:hypothetical protein